MLGNKVVLSPEEVALLVPYLGEPWTIPPESKSQQYCFAGECEKIDKCPGSEYCLLALISNHFENI